MATLAAKNYSLMTCPMCDGRGRGTSREYGLDRGAWICNSCDGSGQVSKYPPKPDVWAGFSSRCEPRG